MSHNGCNEPKVYLPDAAKKRLGLDPEALSGYMRNIGNVLIKAQEGKGSDGFLVKTTVRFKPVETIALFIDGEHKVDVDGTPTIRRKSGWLIRGPGNFFFYIKEEDFNRFFEIVGKEVRL